MRNKILNYTTTTLRSQASKVVRVVNQPGYGVAKAQVAITGVSAVKQGLHACQMIPIALVVTMAKRGVEGTPEDAKLVIEALATDSVTGEVLAKVVRTGTGSELAKALIERRIILPGYNPRAEVTEPRQFYWQGICFILLPRWAV